MDIKTVCFMLMLGIAGSTAFILDDGILNYCGPMSYDYNLCPKGWTCFFNTTDYSSRCVRSHPFTPPIGIECAPCIDDCPVGHELYDNGCEDCSCDTGKLG